MQLLNLISTSTPHLIHSAFLMRERHRPIFRVSFLLFVENGKEESRNVSNKLVTITLAVIFMIKKLAFSQLYCLPRWFSFHVRCLVSANYRILALMFTLLKVNHERSNHKYKLPKMRFMITKRFYC